MLCPQPQATENKSNIKEYAGRDIHPHILEACLNLQSNSLPRSNQTCIAILTALKQVIVDFEAPSIDAQIIFTFVELWSRQTAFLKECKQLHAGVLNALEDADRMILALQSADIKGDQNRLREIKTKMLDWFDTYIADKIVYAQEEMVRLGLELIPKHKKDTILVIGLNYAMEKTLIQACQDERDITVIVVDTCPSFGLRDFASRLSAAGVPVKYTLLTGIGSLIPRATKLFIGASYVLGNGGVVGQIGTSMIAYMASQHKLPVIAFCETYKFTQRVNLDQIKNNEVGEPSEMTGNRLIRACGVTAESIS